MAGNNTATNVAVSLAMGWQVGMATVYTKNQRNAEMFPKDKDRDASTPIDTSGRSSHLICVAGAFECAFNVVSNAEGVVLCQPRVERM